ncbi:MAG: hypothetical protein KKF98_02230 [Bacteroidetes bacterium]|nr:hypothetical protein [Bacteroidota bacterium]
MEKSTLGEALHGSFDSLKEYIDSQFKYNKLVLTQKLGDITSYFALLFIVSALAGGLVLFLSFAFANWFANITNLDEYWGYLIIALFYGAAIGLIIKYREVLLFSPVRNLLGSILFDDDLTVDGKNPFSNRDAMKEEMKLLSHTMKQQQEDLKQQFQTLEQSVTITNIAQELFKNVYKSVVTTKNVAKVVFFLVRRLKPHHENKKHQKKEVD